MPFVVGVMGSFRSLAWQQRCFERTVERLSDSSCLPWAPDYRQNWIALARLKPRHGSPREAAERSSDKANKGLLAQAECFGIGCFGLGSCPSHLSGSSRRARAAASFAKDT